MGLNILMKRDEGKKTYANVYGTGNDETYYPAMENVEWFDSGRYVGDAQFWHNVEWVSMQKKEEHDKEFQHKDYCRPKDFLAAKQWVQEHYKKGTETRLWVALDKMQHDDKLYFLFSF